MVAAARGLPGAIAAFVGALSLVGTGCVGSAEASPRDAWITAKVKVALLLADVPSSDVRVDTLDGRVTLYGSVASLSERVRAGRAAEGILGVSELRDLLRIARAPGGEPVVVTDEVLAAGVQQRLDADPALRDSGIRVKSVDGGLVLLDGQAETLTAHLHALVLAREVRGVRRVASEIECPDSPAGGEIRREASRDGETSASSATSDARITERAKARLIANSITPAFDINVDTRAGVVTLFGTVPTAAARRLAELEVEQLDRVNGVENDLRIVPDVSEVNSERREQRLEDAIEKRLQARVGPGEKLRVERSAVPALDRLVGSDPVAVGSSRGRDDLCGESRDRGADAVSISCPSSAIERLAEPFAARPPQRLRRVLGFVEPSDAYSNR